MTDSRDYMQRAFRAYYRSDGEHAPIPSSFSRLTSHQGRLYAVLENGNGALAVYRIKYDRLRRLRRWPKAVEQC
jgi:hypothetical protein